MVSRWDGTVTHAVSARRTSDHAVRPAASSGLRVGRASSETYGEAAYWPLWAMPWAVILVGYCYLRYWGASASLLNDARLQRAERYARALKPIGKEASYEFCRRLTFVTLIASLLFALCLPIILMDFYRVTFKFFCVVYGFLLVVHLVRIAIAQNISAARAD